MLPTKRRRNILYKSCGLVIVLCIAAMVTVTLVGRYVDGGSLRMADYNVIFFIESVALWAFGIAWLTKGRVRIPYIHALLQERPRQ